MSSFEHSTRLQHLLDRHRAGDAAARAELLEHALERFRHLTRRMFRHHPNLRAIEETDDIVQKGLIRLHTALASVQPADVRAFFGLAARQIRWVLADLAEKHAVLKHAVPLEPPASSIRPRDVPDTAAGEPETLAQWSEFHRAIEQLSDESREVFDLLFYEGLEQTEAATVLGISERTIRRRWQQARLELGRRLGGEWPGE
jgi:RNA polymerase sigma-70 factor (ECF subfamily)